MSLARVATRNVWRNKFRTTLTLIGVAVAILAFVALRTVLAAWAIAADFAAKDRLATRHKMSFVITLPRKYIDEIREVPGVTKATFMTWFGAKYPKNPDMFFGTFAIDTDSLLEVYDEFDVPKEQVERWKDNKKGVIVGKTLAKELGWKIGDKITLTGTIYPGDWEFEVSAIYDLTRKTWDKMSVFFHWDYMNDGVENPYLKDQVGWIVSRVDDADNGPEIAAAIDKRFDTQDIPTLSQSERDMNLSFMGMISALLRALNAVSLIILLIMMMILGNTIAMGVRERTQEYGVLRALGFAPGHIAAFIVGEAVVLGLLGGALGLALAYPIVELGMGRWLEENMGAYFPFFRIPKVTALVAVGIAALLGAVASLWPALGAARLEVTNALRRVG